MQKYLTMNMEIKRFNAKKSGLVYYVAMDAYGRPAKIVDIVCSNTGQHFVTTEENERKLLHKFTKIAKSNTSLETLLNNAIDEAITKHPVLTHTAALTASVALMTVTSMFD